MSAISGDSKHDFDVFIIKNFDRSVAKVSVLKWTLTGNNELRLCEN